VRRGLPILGLFRGMQLASVAPEEMSIAITPSIRKLMKHHQLAMADIDLWELHEAYAVTTLYNQAQLETAWETTNVNGGAIALGHPYGMSGIRYVGQTLLELARRNARRAVVAVCTAGGMATAAFLERPRTKESETAGLTGVTRLLASPGIRAACGSSTHDNLLALLLCDHSIRLHQEYPVAG